MSNHKEGKTEEGKSVHYSVGALIERDGKYLLIDRAIFPYGFAGVAGHVDEGEAPEDAVDHEVLEESGFTVVNKKLVYEEFIPWNECSGGVKGHHWYLFNCMVSGDMQADEREVKSIGWYTKDEIKSLILEPVWEHWFKKLNIIQS